MLIADDHAVVREGLRMLLDAEKDIVVLGEASNGREVEHSIRELVPDVIVMDISMPELNGIEAARRVRMIYPHVQIVILTMYVSAEHIYRALRAGASGYVLKECAGKEVADAVRAVHAGRRYMSRKAHDTMVNDYLQKGAASADVDALEQLSSRERHILQLVAEGRTSVDIAAAVCLSPKTVQSYRSRIMQKLGVDNVAGLVKFAIAHGLIVPE